nr:hypothetical protein CFP56_39839 [Quercus suber]
MFTEEDVAFPEQLENLMPNCISEEENTLLRSLPSPKEMKETLFQMHDIKTPSPDGFPVLFYKEFWPIVGKTVIGVVTSFFENGRVSNEANSSLIILIPKTLNPSMEVLSRMLDRELVAGDINGAKARTRSPTLTHVMYADDIVLFSKATRTNARILSNCLDKYYIWSG